MSKELTLQNIKDIGQSIIDNAENILNKFDYQTRLEIIATLDHGEVPEIQVSNYILPENIVNRYRTIKIWKGAE